MQIAPEVLSEKNYTGSRLIEVKGNDLIDELQKELVSIEEYVKPIVEKLTENYYKIVDPWYQECLIKKEEIKSLKDKIKEVADKYQSEVSEVEKKGEQAQLIKNKLVPIINDHVSSQLGEFEKALHTVVKDGKLYVEVVDEIEEKVKAIRQAKQVK